MITPQEQPSENNEQQCKISSRSPGSGITNPLICRKILFALCCGTVIRVYVLKGLSRAERTGVALTKIAMDFRLSLQLESLWIAVGWGAWP